MPEHFCGSLYKFPSFIPSRYFNNDSTIPIQRSLDNTLCIRENDLVKLNLGWTPPPNAPRSNGATDITLIECPQDRTNDLRSELLDTLEQHIRRHLLSLVHGTQNNDSGTVPHRGVVQQLNDLTAVRDLEAFVPKRLMDKPANLRDLCHRSVSCAGAMEEDGTEVRPHVLYTPQKLI
jgi:hypothetical protein